MSNKLYLRKNVYEMAKERLNKIYNNVDNVAVAYSGGKDSTVLMHLVLETIPKDKELYIYFIDKESNLISTKEYIERQFDYIKEKYKNVHLLWFAIPMREINAMSFYEPWWTSFDPMEKDNWIYEPPKKRYVITNENNILKEYGNDETHTTIYKEINKYISKNNKIKTGVMVGIRTDESLNRFRAVTKYKHLNMDYCTQVDTNVYNFYPIYDWDFRDIWKYHHDNDIEVNPIYQKMWLKGIYKREMRISQSFAGVPKKTLPIYRELEPESFERFCKRVKGINSLTHIDLNIIKRLCDNVDYDYLYNCLPEVYQKALDKTKKNTKDRETIKAILNGDIRLKRKAEKKGDNK
jgi:predicted phosphoadenosine phosphosulfate sulfurtransferase